MHEMLALAYDVCIICVLCRELSTRSLRTLFRLGEKVREHIPKLHLEE